jgi:SAM-dependent methyltransferase
VPACRISHRARDDLRTAFNQAADLYDRFRPGYPEEVLTDLAELGGVGPACRVLELGCGTGQLTLPLAQRGCVITALDIGAEMAALAQKKLAGYPSVRIVVAAFEEWPLPAEPFDAVVSATAFHWLRPEIRVAKSADALRPDGALAVIGTHHIAGGDESFFVEVQACYERWDPSTQPGLRLPAPPDIAFDSEEFDRSGRFGPVSFRRYEWEQTYSSDSYRSLLLTYSGHRALAAEAQQGLLDCISHLIERRYGGKITKRYLTELRLARRQPAE